MYITGKYWDNYIGGSDDSMTLTDYFEYRVGDKKKLKISFKKIIKDFGLDKLGGNFRTSENIGFEGDEIEFPLIYAIDLITDLAALVLECKKSKSVNLAELQDGEPDEDSPEIIINADKSDLALIDKALLDFSENPLEYDLKEMCSENDMLEIAEICGKLRKELLE